MTSAFARRGAAPLALLREDHSVALQPGLTTALDGRDAAAERRHLAGTTVTDGGLALLECSESVCVQEIAQQVAGRQCQFYVEQLALPFERAAAPSLWLAARIGLTNTASACIRLAALLLDGSATERHSSCKLALCFDSGTTLTLFSTAGAMVVSPSPHQLVMAQGALEPVAFRAACGRGTASRGRFGWEPNVGIAWRVGAFHLEAAAKPTPDGAAGRTYTMEDLQPIRYASVPPPMAPTVVQARSSKAACDALPAA